MQNVFRTQKGGKKKIAKQSSKIKTGKKKIQPPERVNIHGVGVQSKMTHMPETPKPQVQFPHTTINQS